MNDIFLFQCPARAFVEARVFVNSDITWSKLMGLVSTRLDIRDSISHLSLKDSGDITTIEQFAEACLSKAYSAGDLSHFVVHLGEPCYPVPSLSRSEMFDPLPVASSQLNDIGGMQKHRQDADGAATQKLPEQRPEELPPPSHHELRSRAHIDVDVDPDILPTVPLRQAELTHRDQVRLRHPATGEALSLSVAQDCDWDRLGADLSTALVLGPEDTLRSGLWSLELLDEDGDTVSSRVDSIKKFRKYLAMQRAAAAGGEDLVFSLVLPDRSNGHSGAPQASSGPGAKPHCRPSTQPSLGSSTRPETSSDTTPQRGGSDGDRNINRRVISHSELSPLAYSTPSPGPHSGSRQGSSQLPLTEHDRRPGSIQDLDAQFDLTPNSTSSSAYKNVRQAQRVAGRMPSQQKCGDAEASPQQRQQQSVFYACSCGDLKMLQESVQDLAEDVQLSLLYYAQCPQQQYSALHYACEGGDDATVKWLLTKYREWNALDIIYVPDSFGFTPLHLLCAGGHVAILRFLREEVVGGSTAAVFFGDVRALDDTNLIHTCVLNAQHETLTWLFQDNSRADNVGFSLEGPLEVNAVNEMGACPLHIACALSDIRMARLLVERGAFVNIHDVNGNTPLFVSCFKNDLIMVQWLHANGATYSQYNKNGFSALHVASRKGNGNLARWLISNGLGDYKLKSDVLGVSPMDEAKLKHHDNVHNMFEEMQEAEEELHALHADFFSCVQEGRVFDAVEALEEEDVDVDCVLPGGNTALHVACSTGCFEMAELLVSRYGAEVDAAHQSTGMTPLHVACAQDQVLLVQWLVQRGGANPMTQCWKGNTVFHYLCQAGNMMLTRWFVELGSVDLNVANIDGFTALYMACKHGFTEIAQYLVECGAFPYTQNAYGTTLLHAASESGHLEVVDWLLHTFHESILVSSQNFSGCTAFHLACAGGHLGVAQACHVVNPSVESIDAFAVQDRNSALHLACQNGQLDIVKWLSEELGLLYNVFNLRNSKGSSPLKLAEDANKVKVVEWIKQQQVPEGTNIHLSEQQAALKDAKSKAKKKVKLALPESQVDELKVEDDGIEVEVEPPKPKKKSFSSFFACMPVNSFAQPNAGAVSHGDASGSLNHASVVQGPYATASSVVTVDLTFSEEVNAGAMKLYDLVTRLNMNDLQAALKSKDRDEVASTLNHVIRDVGRTVIHQACEVGDRGLLQTLLRVVNKGDVDVNVPERLGGDTPLHILCAHNSPLQLEMIILLLGLGADVGAKNRTGETPLHLLCSFPDKGAAIHAMRTVIELPRTVLQHLDLSVKDVAGLSLMHTAVQSHNIGLVQLLCQYSQSLVNSRSDTHVTPLHMAAASGFFDIAETLLVEFRAFVNARDDDGMTALLFACRHGHLRVAKLLVRQGANVSVQEDVVGTALHFACRDGDFTMMKWLVRQGLRPDTENNDGFTAEQLARDQLGMLQARATPGDRGGGGEDEISERHDSADDAEDRAADLTRVTHWLAAWTLADKMGLPVEEVLAEMSTEGKSNGVHISKKSGSGRR